MPLEKNETLFEKVYNVLEKKSLKAVRFGIRKNIINTRGTNFSFENGAFETLAVAQLVKWGYSINDILSNSFPDTLLVKAGQRVMDNFDNDKGIINENGSEMEIDFNNYAKELYFGLANSLSNEIDSKFSGKEIKISDVINGKHKNMLEMNTLLKNSVEELSKEPFTSIFNDEESLGDFEILKKRANKIDSRINPYEKVLENSLKLSGNVYSKKYDKIDPSDISNSFYNVIPYIAQINIDNQVAKSNPNTKVSLNEFDSSFVSKKINDEVKKYNGDKIDKDELTIKAILDLGVNENGEKYIENIGRNLLDEEVTNKIISVENNFGSYNINFNGISPINKVDEISGEYEHKKIKEYSDLSTDEEIIKRASEVVDEKYIENSAFGINGFSIDVNYPFGLNVDRTSLITASIGRMLEKGYTFSEIYSEEYQAARELAMSESIEMMNKYGESDEFKEYATNAYKAVLEKGIEYFEKNFDPNIKIEDMLRKEEYRVFNNLSLTLNDAKQEIGIVNPEWYDANGELVNKQTKISTVLSDLSKTIKGAVALYTCPSDQIQGNEDARPSKFLRGIIRYKLVRDKANDDPNYMLSTDSGFSEFDSEAYDVIEPYDSDLEFASEFNQLSLDKEKAKKMALSLLSTDSHDKIIGKEKGKYKLTNVLQLAEDISAQKSQINEDKYAEVNTSYVKIEDARKWFDSFKTMLNQNGYHTENVETALYLKAISTVRDSKDYQYAIPYEKHILRKSKEELDAFNLIYGNKTINLINDEDIKELYMLAKEGKLTLTPKDFNMQKLKSIYVKDDGTCGLSSPVDEILGVDNVVAENNFEGKEVGLDGKPSSVIKDAVNKNRRLVKNIYNETVKDKFPGVKDPFSIADKLTFYTQSRERRSFSGLLSENEIDELNIKETWESTVLGDYNKHPEFYRGDIAKKRGEHFKNSVFANMSSNLNIKEQYDKLAKENPAGYYDEMEEVVFKAANNFYGNLVLNNDPSKNKELLIKKFINEGHVRNVLNENYRDKEKIAPWDMLENISKDLAKGIEVVCDVKKRDEVHEHLITMDGEIKLKKNPVDKIDQVQKNNIIDYLRRNKETLINNGITKRDSNEFKNLMTCLDETIKQLNGTVSKAGFTEKLNLLKRSANGYYFAKLDESHNSRRSRRFKICEALSNIGENKTDIDKAKERIAAKAVKSYYKIRLESVNEEVRDEASSILNSVNKEKFKNKVKELMESESFNLTYGNKTLAQLEKEFKISPVELVHKAYSTRNPENNVARNNGHNQISNNTKDRNIDKNDELLFH